MNECRSRELEGGGDNPDLEPHGRKEGPAVSVFTEPGVVRRSLLRESARVSGVRLRGQPYPPRFARRESVPLWGTG